MIEQSDTPRVDAEASEGWTGDAVCVSESFARQLERELNEAKADNIGASKIIENYINEVAGLKHQLTTLRAVADGFAGRLIYYQKRDDHMLSCMCKTCESFAAYEQWKKGVEK